MKQFAQPAEVEWFQPVMVHIGVMPVILQPVHRLLVIAGMRIEYDLPMFSPSAPIRQLVLTLLLTFSTAALPATPAGDTLPALNGRVVEFVEANLKKKVGRGECWDLAAKALEHAGASWDGAYRFGRLIDPENEEILPGDIIQFENVVTRDRTGNVKREERMPKHTAIIYKVHDEGIFTLAHQNTDVSGKKVGTSRFLLDSVVRGKVIVYRPVENL
jgi:hypothetical protein